MAAKPTSSHDVATRASPSPTRQAEVTRRKAELRGPVTRHLWTEGEYERLHDAELLVSERIEEDALAPDFLTVAVPAQIQRIVGDIDKVIEARGQYHPKPTTTVLQHRLRELRTLYRSSG